MGRINGSVDGCLPSCLYANMGFWYNYDLVCLSTCTHNPQCMSRPQDRKTIRGNYVFYCCIFPAYYYHNGILFPYHNPHHPYNCYSGWRRVL